MNISLPKLKKYQLEAPYVKTKEVQVCSEVTFCKLEETFNRKRQNICSKTEQSYSKENIMTN